MCLCAPTTLSTQKVKEALGTCTVLSKGTFFLLSYLRFSGIIICAFQYVAPTPHQHWNAFIWMPSLGCFPWDSFIGMASFGCLLQDAFLWIPFKRNHFKMLSSGRIFWDAFFGMLSSGCLLLIGFFGIPSLWNYFFWMHSSEFIYWDGFFGMPSFHVISVSNASLKLKS